MPDLALPPSPVDILAMGKSGPSPDVAAVRTRDQARAVAQEFERLFLAEMLQPMFDGVEVDETFGGGSAEAAFRPMLIDQYADAIARGGGVGIADAVYREILKLQGLE